MRIFEPVVQGLGSAIDLLQQRHRVLSENVANAETPGYRARDLDFESELLNAFEPGASRESDVEASVDRAAIVKVDGNSVDLDTEMSRLSENALKIVALSRLLARKYEGLKAAIDGGRG